MMSKLHIALLLAVTLTCAIGCRRDDRVEPGPYVPVDGRQKFVGTYDVYDTLGNWKYEMQISLYEGEPIDSFLLKDVEMILMFTFNTIGIINLIF